MIETVKEHCKHPDCKYRGKTTLIESCDYIMIARKPRGCSISKCDKYATGKKKLISTLGGFKYEYEDEDWW